MVNSPTRPEQESSVFRQMLIAATFPGNIREYRDYQEEAELCEEVKKEREYDFRLNDDQTLSEALGPDAWDKFAGGEDLIYLLARTAITSNKDDLYLALGRTIADRAERYLKGDWD